MQLDPGDRLHLLQVDADDAALRLARLGTKRVDPGHRHQRPSAWRTAQIDDPRAGHQKSVFVVQFQDLERRAAAIAFLAGLDHVRIVELATACAPLPS